MIKPEQTWREVPNLPETLPVFIRDSVNEQVGTLVAGGTFVGNWTLVDGFCSFLVLYASNVPFTMQIQWSKDGISQDLDPFATITPQVRSALGLYSVISPQSTFFRPYYRIKIINGAVGQVFVVSDSLLMTTVFSGYDISVDGPIPTLGLAKLGIGLNWAKGPTGWQPTQLTAAGNTKIALTENLLGNLPVTVTNFPAPIIAPTYSKFFGIGTGLPQLIKTGSGTLHSVILSGSPSFQVYGDLLGIANKFIDVSATANTLGTLDIPFTIGLTVKVQTGKPFTIIFL